MTCRCALSEGTHWYVDRKNANYLYQIARSPEEAEAYLKRWCSRILRGGFAHGDLKPMAAKVLGSHRLCMAPICATNIPVPELSID